MLCAITANNPELRVFHTHSVSSNLLYFVLEHCKHLQEYCSEVLLNMSKVQVLLVQYPALSVLHSHLVDVCRRTYVDIMTHYGLPRKLLPFVNEFPINAFRMYTGFIDDDELTRLVIKSSACLQVLILRTSCYVIPQTLLGKNFTWNVMYSLTSCQVALVSVVMSYEH